MKMKGLPIRSPFVLVGSSIGSAMAKKDKGISVANSFFGNNVPFTF
jgi:hypothetical protein